MSDDPHQGPRRGRGPLDRPQPPGEAQRHRPGHRRRALRGPGRRPQDGPCVLIVHSATPGIFAAGADIAELRDRDADAALLAINAGLFEKLEAHRWPTIAAVDGPALGGGCELALACDFRIASHHAYFGQPELSLGILAGAGGNWRLAQTAGQQVARRMLYAGARLTAADALAAGLVDELADDPDAAAVALAGQDHPPVLARPRAHQARPALAPPRHHHLRHGGPGPAVRAARTSTTG